MLRAKSLDESELSNKHLRKKIDAENISAANKVPNGLNAISGYESRVSVLEHLQIGSSPTGYDRVLATQFATKAAELLFRGKYYVLMVTEGLEVVMVPLENIAGKIKGVPLDFIRAIC